MIINDVDLCEDDDHVNKFSIIIKNDSTRLKKILILDAAQPVVLFIEQTY